MEETGYTLGEIRFAALAEEIFTDPHLRARYPEYTHRMMHIFLSEPGDEPPLAPTEKDLGMVESLWLPLEEAARLMRNSDVQGILVIRQNFDQELARGGVGGLQLLVDGSEPNTAQFIQSYSQGLITNWQRTSLPGGAGFAEAAAHILAQRGRA